MRGNELDTATPATPTADGFQIPMRGNENPHTFALENATCEFQIPMRGNEDKSFTVCGDERRVPNPHEG